MKKILLVIISVLILAAGAFYFFQSQPKTYPVDTTDQPTSSPPITQTPKKSLFNLKPPPPAKTTEAGLITYLAFDENQGKTLSDSADSVQATIHGATWTKGVKNSALKFDGNDYVELDQNTLQKISNLNQGTISIWFKFNSFPKNQILPLFYLGDSQGQTKNDNLIIEIGHFNHGAPPDTKLYYTLYHNQFEPILCFDSNLNLQPDTWYHFAVVSDSTGNTGYLNGQELTNRHYNFSHQKDTRFFSTLTDQDIFRLGYGWFGIDQQFHYFNGSLDELKIYNQPLTAKQIKNLYNLN